MITELLIFKVPIFLLGLTQTLAKIPDVRLIRLDLASAHVAGYQESTSGSLGRQNRKLDFAKLELTRGKSTNFLLHYPHRQLTLVIENQFSQHQRVVQIVIYFG